MICETCHGEGVYLNTLLGEIRPCIDCNGSGVSSCCDAAGSMSSFAASNEGEKTDTPSFTCPNCQTISYNPNDIAQRYCGACHAFVDDAPGADRYRNDAFPPRPCDYCGRPYQGPAVYCSFSCALADA